ACGVECYHNTFQRVGNLAYLDMPMTSLNFCKAAERAVDVIITIPAVDLLQGATAVFQIAGVGMCTLASALFSFLVIRHVDSDPKNLEFVEGKNTVVVVAAIVGFAVGCSLMTVFDT
ncbi:unnamed protein product, partial [Polarella glacialis]